MAFLFRIFATVGERFATSRSSAGANSCSRSSHLTSRAARCLLSAPGEHVREMPRLAVWMISVEGLLEELVWCPQSPNGELDRLGHPAPSHSELVVQKIVFGQQVAAGHSACGRESLALGLGPCFHEGPLRAGDGEVEDVLVFRDELTQRAPTRLSVNANAWVSCWAHPSTLSRGRGRRGDVVCGRQGSDVLVQLVWVLRLLAGEEADLLGSAPGLVPMGLRLAWATQVQSRDVRQVGHDAGGLVAMSSIHTILEDGLEDASLVHRFEETRHVPKERIGGIPDRPSGLRASPKQLQTGFVREDGQGIAALDAVEEILRMDERAAVAGEKAPCRVATRKPKWMIDRPRWLWIARARLAQMPRHLALAGTREGTTRCAPMDMREPRILEEAAKQFLPVRLREVDGDHAGLARPVHAEAREADTNGFRREARRASEHLDEELLSGSRRRWNHWHVCVRDRPRLSGLAATADDEWNFAWKSRKTLQLRPEATTRRGWCRNRPWSLGPFRRPGGTEGNEVGELQEGEVCEDDPRGPSAHPTRGTEQDDGDSETGGPHGEQVDNGPPMGSLGPWGPSTFPEQGTEEARDGDEDGEAGTPVRSSPEPTSWVHPHCLCWEHQVCA